MCKHHLGLTVLSILLMMAISIHRVSGVAVMSVDFGSEWMEVGVVSPGVPMEIVLNKESKRKTPAAVAFRNNERLFGEDALNVALRFPANSYQYLLDLLGKTVDNPVVQLYRKRFPHYNIEGSADRNTVVFRTGNETHSVEELVAQLLEKARGFAEETLGQTIKECVLVVPGFFSQSERLALLSAAKLADLKVLQLINDYTAIALNYGVFRLKDINETAQYFVFYDMGAYKTSAAVVSLQLVKDKVTKETNPVIKVHGVGYDRTLGGLEMQLRLRDYLGQEFNKMKKTPTDVFTCPRAMAKLFKEAGRVKNILSANAHHFAQIEGLIDEKDFKFEVTREKFEELTADLYDRVMGPLNRALKSAERGIELMNQVILFGGSTRVPKVQEVLKNAIKQELGKNINMDEAATLGAVYKAADLANGFKVKKIIVKDAVLFPIQVVFDRENHNTENVGQNRQIKRALFSAMNPYPQKKVITFNRQTHDFTFNVNYGDLDHLPADEIANLGSLNLTEVFLKGIHLIVNASTGEKMKPRGIKAHFNMDESGIFELTGTDLMVEKIIHDIEPTESTLSKIGSTISKLILGDNVDDEKKEEIQQVEEPVASQESNEEDKKDEGDQDDEKIKEETQKKKDEKSKEKSKEKSSKEDKKEKELKKGTASDETGNLNETDTKVKTTIEKEPLKNIQKHLYVEPLKGKSFREAQDKLNQLTEYEKQIARRQTAQNALETFVIEANLRLDDDEWSSCATESQIEIIRKACSEVGNWLYEDGENADAETYEKKLAELHDLTNEMYSKHWEHYHRSNALETLEKLIDSAKQFLKGISNLTKEADPEKDVFTQVEITGLDKAINDTIEWRNKEIPEQEKLSRNAPIRVSIKTITERMHVLDREIKYLTNKMKIWRPKIKETPKKETANKTDNADEDQPRKDDVKLDAEKHENETDTMPTEQEKLDFPEIIGEFVEPAAAEAVAASNETNDKGIDADSTEKDTDQHTEL